MREVTQVVRRAGWRLWAFDLVRVSGLVASMGVGALLLTRVTERVLGAAPTMEPIWPRIFTWAPIAAAGIALTWTLLRRRRDLDVAREVDERAGLKDSLTTALYLDRDPASRNDPWSFNVLDSARRTATGVKVGLVLPFQWPTLNNWFIAGGLGCVLGLTWMFMPNFDLLGETAKKQAVEQKKQEVQLVKADVQSKQDKLKEMLAKAKVEFTEEKAQPADGDKKLEENDPEAIRRAAVKQLTSLTEKLEQQKEGEKPAQLESLKEAMRQLKQPGPGPLDEVSRQMARGDFNKAQQAMKELQKQLADNSLSNDAKEQLKKQAENLSKQMEKMAENKQALEKKLESSGLDKKTAQELAQKAAAANPEDIKKALEAMKNLTEEQKKQLLEMAVASAKSQSMAQSMSEGLQKMANGMQQNGLQQEGMEGLQQLSNELSQAEMMQGDMQQLDAALKEAQKQLSELAGQCMGDNPGDGGNGNGKGQGQGMGQGNGAWGEGASNRYGKGSGGPGKGNGFSPESEPVDYTTEKVKANVKNTGGPIIGSRLVYGEQVKGESVAEFSSVVAASTQEASEAIENNQVPRELHDAVKHYFGTLQEKVKKDQAKPATPAAPK